MAKTQEGSAMPEDSIAAMPVGEEIALAVDLPENQMSPFSWILFPWRILKLNSSGFLHSGSTKKMHFTNGILIRVGTQEPLVALMSEWVTFTSAPQKFSRT